MDTVQTNRSTKQSWLDGPGDLKQDTVEDVPIAGESVLVRGLPAAYSNQATSEALEMKTVGSQQVATVNTARLEVLQFQHGCVDPQFTTQEAEQIAEKYGPAFKKVVARIDELSGVNKEALDKAQARFPGNGVGENGSAVEDGTSSGGGERVVPVRTGAGDANANR